MASSHSERVVAAVLPAAALVVAASGAAITLPAGSWSAAFTALQFVMLVGAVFASVIHADIISHRTGEPYGTLVLTVAVTVIEVALIVSIMIAGDGSPTLARDTVLAVLMLVCNGLVGVCLLAGGLRFGEQEFRVPGVITYLGVLMPLATLTLILPSYTVSRAGPFFSYGQLLFISAVTLALYAVFLYVQTIRHRDYFLSDSGADLAGAAVPTEPAFRASIVHLLTALGATVLLAKNLGGSIKGLVTTLGAPIGLVGLLVAAIVLLPETIAAVRAARGNQLQKSLNLALGSSLATIGLTIPAVGLLSVYIERPIALGLEPRDVVLLALTFAVSLATFGSGRTNILSGFVHLVLFATYVFLIFAP
jgi:Ca2+:H+ antiporter